MNIANQAMSSSAGASWKQQAGNYSRFGFIDELMDLKNQSFRLAFQKYHFDGIDLLDTDPQTGLQNILQAVTSIAQLRPQNPRSLLLKTFFETKYMEIADVFRQYPDKAVFEQLATLDPGHQATYQEYSQK